MMGNREAQASAIQLVTLEELVPRDHFLRTLDRALALGFVPGFLKKAYPSRRGRPGVDTRLAVTLSTQLKTLEAIESRDKDSS